MPYTEFSPSQDIFSIDIITSGPNTREYSILQIGGCLVGSGVRNRIFDATLKPTTKHESPSYLSTHGVSLKKAEEMGQNPGEVMDALKNWINSCGSYKNEKVYLGYATPHDWPFLEYYFNRYCSSSYRKSGPFSQNYICLKTLFSAKTETPVSKVTKKLIRNTLGICSPQVYNSTQLAVENAEIFYKLMEA